MAKPANPHLSKSPYAVRFLSADLSKAAHLNSRLGNIASVTAILRAAATVGLDAMASMDSETLLAALRGEVK